MCVFTHFVLWSCTPPQALKAKRAIGVRHPPKTTEKTVTKPTVGLESVCFHAFRALVLYPPTGFEGKTADWRETSKNVVFEVVFGTMFKESVRHHVQWKCSAPCSREVFGTMFKGSVRHDVQGKCSAPCSREVVGTIFKGSVRHDVQGNTSPESLWEAFWARAANLYF